MASLVRVDWRMGLLVWGGTLLAVCAARESDTVYFWFAARLANLY